MSAERKTENKKADNDIRIGMKSRQRYVIKYASSIMKEKNYKELKFSAVGGSIGKLLDIVEVLKILIPGLYQQNRITSVAYQTVDSNSTVINQRLYPKLEVILSTEDFKSKNEGTQGKLDEKKRKELEDVLTRRRQEREKMMERNQRGRGFRGRRGGFRGRRRGFRGYRGEGSRRGGFRARGRGFRARGRGRGGPSTRGQNPRNAPKVNRGRGTK